MRCRYTERFIAAGGVQALTAVLEGSGEWVQQLRLAVAALDCLTRCGGAAACEAALGWWAPTTSLESGEEAGREGLAPDGAAHPGEPYSLQNGHDNAPSITGQVRPRCRGALARLPSWLLLIWPSYCADALSWLAAWPWSRTSEVDLIGSTAARRLHPPMAVRMKELLLLLVCSTGTGQCRNTILKSCSMLAACLHKALCLRFQRSVI